MPHHSFRKPRISYVQEKQIVEPESSCECHVVRRSQSGREIDEKKITLRKCESVNESSKKNKKGQVRRIETRNLRVPQIPEKIVNLVNILQHENFLKVVDQYFKSGVKNQSRKKSQGKKSTSIKNSSSSTATQTDFDSKKA